MQKILKWNIPVDDKTHKIGGGEVVHVGAQGAIDVVQVWTLETIKTSGELEKPYVDAQVFGTGQPLKDGAFYPLGSVIVGNGHLVWHVLRVIWDEKEE